MHRGGGAGGGGALMVASVAQSFRDVDPVSAVVIPLGHLTHEGLGTDALPPAEY